MEDPRKVALDSLLLLATYEVIHIYYLDFNWPVLGLHAMQLLLLHRVVKPRNSSLASYVFYCVMFINVPVLFFHLLGVHFRPLLLVLIGSPLPASTPVILLHDCFLTFLQTSIALNRRCIET